MATTYELISSNTLGSSAASVTFSAIPSTYTDLVLKVSARNNDTGTSYFRVSMNGDTASNYSRTTLVGTGSAVSSGRDSNVTYGFSALYLPSSSNTSNTFSSSELYFPNYNSTASKPVNIYSTEENNSSTSYMISAAGLYRGTNITSITCDESFGGLQFVAGSSFYLYGIKNS
jgi:hypothetical protein